MMEQKVVLITGGSRAIGTPEDVAEAIWYLSSDAARFVTGQVLAPNGGLVI